MGRGYGERQYVGAEIRRLRREGEMTLDELAEAAGISPSHLSRLERGLTLPSFVVLAGLASALEVKLEHFVQLEEEIGALNGRLREQLVAAGLGDAAIQEILQLTVPARRAVSEALAG